MEKPIIIDVEWREIKTEKVPLKEESGEIKHLTLFDYVVRTMFTVECGYFLIRMILGFVQNYQFWAKQGEVTIKMIVTGMP